MNHNAVTNYLHPTKLRWNPNMEVWFRWFSFSILWWLLGSIWIFQGVKETHWEMQQWTYLFIQHVLLIQHDRKWPFSSGWLPKQILYCIVFMYSIYIISPLRHLSQSKVNIATAWFSPPIFPSRDFPMSIPHPLDKRMQYAVPWTSLMPCCDLVNCPCGFVTTPGSSSPARNRSTLFKR